MYKEVPTLGFKKIATPAIFRYKHQDFTPIGLHSLQLKEGLSFPKMGLSFSYFAHIIFVSIQSFD